MDGELGSSLPRGHLRTVGRSVHVAVDPHAIDLAAAIAARHGVRSAQAVCGDGSTELIRLAAGLHDRGWTTEPTAAGFFLGRVSGAAEACAALLAQGCLVRDYSTFGLPEHARVSPRHPAQNDRLPAACGSP